MPFPEQTPRELTRQNVEMLRPGRLGCHGLFQGDRWVYVGKRVRFGSDSSRTSTATTGVSGLVAPVLGLCDFTMQDSRRECKRGATNHRSTLHTPELGITPAEGSAR